MYESRHKPLAPLSRFRRRLFRNGLIALVVIFVSLAVGVIGYHLLERLPWIDALLNASMILGGMGPVNELHTVAGKLFASFYALFSGILLISIAGILFAPVVHRFLHRFHLEEVGMPKK